MSRFYSFFETAPLYLLNLLVTNHQRWKLCKTSCASGTTRLLRFALVAYFSRTMLNRVFDNKAVLEPWVSPTFAIAYFCNHCNISPTRMVIDQRKWIQWLFFQKLQRSMTPRWPVTPLLLRSRVTLPKDHCTQVPWKYVKVCGYLDPYIF